MNAFRFFPRPLGLGLLFISLLLLCGGIPASFAGKLPPARPAAIQDLGNDRYRIGSIELDKAGRRFSVPGILLPVQGPLEYIAVAKGGVKAYESLLELQTSAIEFNTACILIGLDNENAVPPKFHFDPAPAKGDPVRLTISWSHEGKRLEVPAEDLLRDKDNPSAGAEWVYTGSTFLRNNRFLAEKDGTLVGFVHDPSSIIEHRAGLGLGDYGAIKGNFTKLPPPGATMILTVVNP